MPVLCLSGQKKISEYNFTCPNCLFDLEDTGRARNGVQYNKPKRTEEMWQQQVNRPGIVIWGNQLKLKTQHLTHSTQLFDQLLI